MDSYHLTRQDNRRLAKFLELLHFLGHLRNHILHNFRAERQIYAAVAVRQAGDNVLFQIRVQRYDPHTVAFAESSGNSTFQRNTDILRNSI